MAGESTLVWGRGPVRELLAARPREVVVLYSSQARGDLAELARRRGVQVEPRVRAELDDIAGPGARHQGVVAVAGPYRYADLDDILAAAAAPALVVALDRIQDPRNLGAVVRSAYLFGAHGVVLPKDRAAEVTAAVRKTACGATERVPIARVTNLARALAEMRQRGLWLTALERGDGARPLWALPAAEPLCLVVGGEGRGVRRLVARQCDYRIEIPLQGTAIGSLNASVAAGIALYEIARQRGRQG